MRRLGRREWYASSGYSRRSLVENAVFRYKSILGQRMRSRSLPNQRVEVSLACKILNTMASLGRPDSYHRFSPTPLPTIYKNQYNAPWT